MSLILDALRKSDRQRSRRATEQLRWGPGPASSKPPQHGPAWLAFGLLALLLLGAAAWLGTWLANPAAGDGQNMENGSPRTSPQRSAASVRSLSAELATPAEQQSGTAAAAEPGGAETVAARDSLLVAPDLSEMPQDFRQQLPPLEINVHAWSEVPAERFVLINMQRFAEGERLPEGLQLRQVTPDGVVLEYRGELFTLTQR